MTTGKTIALTRRTFVGKVMSLLFNMLSRLAITFLPRSKRLLISWLPLQKCKFTFPSGAVRALLFKRTKAEGAWHFWIFCPTLALTASNSAAKSVNSQTKWFLHSHYIALRSSDLWGNLPYSTSFSMPIHQANEQFISATVHCHLNEFLKDIYCCQFQY